MHFLYLLGRRELVSTWALPLIVIGMVLAALVTVTLVLWLSGTLPKVLDAPFGLNTVSGDGKIGGLFLANALVQIRTSAFPMTIMCVPLTALVVAMHRGQSVICVVAAVAFAVATLMSFRWLAEGEGRFFAPVLLALSAWLVFSAVELAATWNASAACKPDGEEGRVLVALAGPTLALCLCAGSSLGLLKLSYGATILFPLIVAWSRRLASHIRQTWVRRALGIALLVPIVLTGHLVWEFLVSPTTGYVYGDAARIQLTAAFERGRLAGIITQPGRRGSFKEIADVVERYSKPDDEILAFSNFAMIYYATRRRPPFGLSAPDFLLPHSRLEEAVHHLCNDAATRPALIVRTRTSMASHTWGTPEAEVVGAFLPGPFWETNRRILDETVDRSCNPELLWSNHDFEVLRPHAGDSLR
jgi:hypothetical protein